MLIFQSVCFFLGAEQNEKKKHSGGQVGDIFLEDFFLVWSLKVKVMI